MVKKHKGGRRQILQLEDKKQPSRSESEPSSSASNKEASPLDSQVADFFKEIDALTVNNHAETDNSEAACAPSDIASCSKQKDSEESNSLDGLPEKTEDCQAEGSKTENYCPWQEICDESTGYNYYWNVDTNEVTWECPTEYIIFLKNMHSTSGEDFPQSNQSNSNENHKKAKKKKDTSQPPEGAIIPISYFGESSSEDSSDEEKENGLGTTSKYSNIKAEPNIVISNKKTGRKKDLHYNKSKREPCVEMGPHLPDENHFSKAVSSPSRTSVPFKEAEINSKNEVDEYLEIGPQLASNSGMDLSKNTDLNTDCNTVSDSLSKCTNAPHSIKNGPSDASSSTVDEPWELSLKIIEREFKGLDQDIGEDSPDSTVKKGDNFSENSVPCQTTNETFVRGVVEYDNFTDDEEGEEEMSSSNISSSKQESTPVHRILPSESKLSREEKNSYQGQRMCDSKSQVSHSQSQQNLYKRKFSGKTNETGYLNFKKSRQKANSIDFDKIFSNHGNSGKYGFGFSRQEQLNLESEFFCSTSSHNQSNSGKGSSDYKTISFVKSDHVFDLSTLNKNISSDNASQSKSNESEQASDNKNENIHAPGPSGLNLVREIKDSKKTLVSESEFVYNEDDNFNRKNIDASNFINDSLAQSVNTEPGTSCEKDQLKDVSSSKVNNLFKVDEDIDEIDRQLSEALEAKKAENSASKPSSSSPLLSSRAKKTETDSSTVKVTSIESAKFASSAESSESLSDDIVSLATLLVDKLTFLISNHSTLTSLSSLLIQIQTRLMDWQSSALESTYFMSRLQEVKQYLDHYELSVASGDWTCQWDRENKRYFYLNSRTQQSQWSYPEELCDKENSWMPSSTELATTSNASSELSLERDELQTVSSSVPEGQLNNKPSTFTSESNKDTSDKYSDSSSMWLSESSPPPPPPGVDSPPPPPPHSPPPDSPPPPPPDSTEVEDLLEDMDIENSDDSNPPLIVTNSGMDTPADTVMPYPKFAVPSPERSEIFPSASVSNAVSSTSLSSFEDMSTVLKSPQLVSTSRDTFETADSVNMHWSMSQPSCSTDIASNFDSESEANVLPDLKLLSSDKDSDANASSSSGRNCGANASSTSSRSCDINASSTSSRSCDINASSTSSRSYDVNASSTSSRNSDVNASSSSYRNCDVNTSSSNYSDVNASCSSTRNCDVNASSSSGRSYLCSNEVTTYRKNGGPYPSTSTSSSATTTSSRKEKKKAKLSSGLALKKKNIPSLVEKWQKIKEEQEKEDKDSEDPRN